MRRPHIKKFSVALITSALALSLTACGGSGPDAATRLIKRVTDGNEVTVTTNGNDLAIANLLLVATEDGSAVVVGTIVNHAKTADALLGISAGGTTATLSGEQNLVQDMPIRFEGDSANAKAVFAGVGAIAGRNVTLQLAFARAGVVTVNAIIRDKRDTYANVTN
jgi:antitoxin (DNA-binding transcriptional repressor) of toxin-antitoxin stability system